MGCHPWPQEPHEQNDDETSPRRPPKPYTYACPPYRTPLVPRASPSDSPHTPLSPLGVESARTLCEPTSGGRSQTQTFRMCRDTTPTTTTAPSHPPSPSLISAQPKDSQAPPPPPPPPPPSPIEPPAVARAVHAVPDRVGAGHPPPPRSPLSLRSVKRPIGPHSTLRGSSYASAGSLGFAHPDSTPPAILPHHCYSHPPRYAYCSRPYRLPPPPSPSPLSSSPLLPFAPPLTIRSLSPVSPFRLCTFLFRFRPTPSLLPSYSPSLLPPPTSPLISPSMPSFPGAALPITTFSPSASSPPERNAPSDSCPSSRHFCPHLLPSPCASARAPMHESPHLSPPSPPPTSSPRTPPHCTASRLPSLRRRLTAPRRPPADTPNPPPYRPARSRPDCVLGRMRCRANTHTTAIYPPLSPPPTPPAPSHVIAAAVLRTSRHRLPLPRVRPDCPNPLPLYSKRPLTSV